MKNLFLFFVLICSSSIISAQCVAGGSAPIPTAGSSIANLTSNTSGSISGFQNASFSGANFISQNLGLSYSSNKFAYQNIKGSPYLNNEPVKGTLVLNDGRKIEEILLQIDLYTDQIIATTKKGEEIILHEEYFKEVVLPVNGEQIVFKKANPEDPNKFYEVLFEDDGLVFFKQNYATLRNGFNNGISKREAKFNNRTKYFIKHGENEIANVKLKKKDIFLGFQDDELYAMKRYANEHGIEFRDETDYVAVFEGFTEEKLNRK